MAIDRVNAVFIGRIKDEHGFSAELLEDPITSARFLAYEPETWWQRGHYLQHLEAMGKRPAGERHEDLKRRHSGTGER